jgi:tRNA (guanine37-N1)-methyltransferase
MRSGGQDGTDWEIGRLMVAPDLQGRGLGRWLLERAEAAAPTGTRRMSLFTGVGSARNLRTYRRAGYRHDRDRADSPAVLHLSKPVRPGG